VLERCFFLDVFNFAGFAERVVRKAIKLGNIAVKVFRDEGSEIPNIGEVN
jgi:hypothetical protein